MSNEIEPLAESLTLMPFETGASLASRLAAMNRAGNARQFCWDYFVKFEEIAAGNVAELRKLSILASVNLEALIRWSPRRVGQYNFSIGDEVITTFRSRRSRFRVCVGCIDAALAAHPELPADAAVAVPVYTLVDPVRTCPVHGMSLVQVADKRSFGDHSQDYAIPIADALEDLDELRASSVRRAVSDFENYLLGRLGIRPRKAVQLLDDLEITQVMTICEGLGSFRLYGRHAAISELDEPDQHAAAQRGFETLARGEEGVREFVTDAHQRAASEDKAGMSSTMFGRVRSLLNSQTRSRRFDPIKQILVDRLSELVPYGPEDPPIFGMRPARRYWHTLISAERHYGVAYRTIKKNVERAGIHQRLNLTFDKTRFAIPAEELDGLMTSPDALIPRMEVIVLTGVHAKDFTALADAGLLRPITGRPDSASSMFRRGDVTVLEKALLSRAEPMTTEMPGWVTVHAAFLSTSWSRADVFRHIASGAAAVCSVKGEKSAASLRVKLDDLRRLHPLFGRDVISMEDAAAILEVSETVVNRLVKTSWIEAHNVRSEQTGKLKIGLCKDDVLAFQRTYIPVSEIWRRRGGPMIKINPLLGSHGLRPSFPPDKLRCTFYRRAEVDQVFPPSATSPPAETPAPLEPTPLS